MLPPATPAPAHTHGEAPQPKESTSCKSSGVATVAVEVRRRDVDSSEKVVLPHPDIVPVHRLVFGVFNPPGPNHASESHGHVVDHFAVVKRDGRGVAQDLPHAREREVVTCSLHGTHERLSHHVCGYHATVVMSDVVRNQTPARGLRFMFAGFGALCRTSLVNVISWFSSLSATVAKP